MRKICVVEVTYEYLRLRLRNLLQESAGREQHQHPDQQAALHASQVLRYHRLQHSVAARVLYGCVYIVYTSSDSIALPSTVRSSMPAVGYTSVINR